jgi:hypothetical protein
MGVILGIGILGVIIYLASDYKNYWSSDNEEQRANDRKYWRDRENRKK